MIGVSDPFDKVFLVVSACTVVKYAFNFKFRNVVDCDRWRRRCYGRVRRVRFAEETSEEECQ
jgi:hypothetical protein